MKELKNPTMKIIARIRSDFPEKFGIPRQAGLVPELVSKIVFEPEFRDPNALRGIEEWTHLWLIWQFSEAIRDEWSPTVRPPRLGGNERVGVFATRSPFRPNPIGLSSVRLERVAAEDGLGTVLYVSGADLMDGTPIYDIKPYLPFTDCRPEAFGGFAEAVKDKSLKVIFPDCLKNGLGEETVTTLRELLAQDPRPSYQRENTRVYGMDYGGIEVRFTVDGDALTVREVNDTNRKP